MGSYEAVIGLEIHVQLNTNSKIFCACKADSWGDPPNFNICPVCTGQPGVLPVPNQAVIDKGVLLAAAMNAEIQPISYFDRKNYFYPDLPKGYQISQYDLALGSGGYMDLPLEDGSTRRVKIEKLHIEEDAGKTIHKPGRRLLDFNRCGVPLVEMVTAPDLRSADEAADFIRRFRQLLRWIGVSEASMEKGQMRFDANVSIREKGAKILNPKTEIKNVNSIEHGRDAMKAEIKRQIKEVEAGNKIDAWTLDWNEDTQTLSKMRSKETEADYRYFKEPDLLAVTLTEERIQELIASLPELPDARENRFIEEYNLSRKEANILTSDIAFSNFFIDSVETYDSDAQASSNWLINDVQGMMNDLDLSISDFFFSPEHLASILTMVDEGKINTSTGKTLVRKTQELGKDPAVIVEEEGLAQLTDTAAIESICQEVIQENPDQVEQFNSGKGGVIGWLVGQVMAKSGGKADPQAVRETLEGLLK
ncbi:MAG: Asp-tRNA(Asn)/Glu-tRNA(Gln) amidotransferase subunit GatB [Anaerolineales bacterium]|nr:Asp-tRNA(Asn)/Glu-tRNA(Gln) amidotransferase subunit GatB [Anaerolineales bacterium]